MNYFFNLIADMLKDFAEFLGTEFTSGGMKFHVDEHGCVYCDDGMLLGNLEECREEGKSLMDLLDLLGSINL